MANLENRKIEEKNKVNNINRNNTKNNNIKNNNINSNRNNAKNKAKEEKKQINVFKIIIVIAIIFAIIFLIFKLTTKNQGNNSIIGEQSKDEKYVRIVGDGVKLNSSSKLNEDKMYGELKITNIQLTYRDGITNLLCNIKNTSNKATDLKNVKIILLDEFESTIYELTGILEGIEPGETKQFNTNITADFANAYDFKIVIE